MRMKPGWLILSVCFLLAGGRLVADNAPVTTAGVVTNATPGTQVIIPVSVAGFNSIGRFTLTLTFDTTLTRFVSATTHSFLAGMTVTYSKTPSTTQGKLLFSWIGSTNASLPDGSVLSYLTMTYVTSTANLRWADSYGNVCEYKRFVNGNPVILTDTPQYQFYKDGGVSSRGAPVTTAPSVTVNNTGTVALPITVGGFTDIGALTLNLEYDPAIMTYVSFTRNPAFGSTFQVGSIPGTGGKKNMVIQWYGTSLTLPAGATLCTLSFNYTATSGNGTLLSWIDNGSSCEFADGPGAVLIDQPQSQYYINGQVTPPMVSATIAASANPVCPGLPVTFSASVLNGGASPGYLWKVNGVNSGNASSLIYVPANNDQVNCTVTSSLPLAGNNPSPSNIIVMTVYSVSAVSSEFTADTLLPARTDTVHLQDLSNGLPTFWFWTFDPPWAEFLAGTNENSANPVVRFPDGGGYSVSLVAGNLCFSDTLMKTDYIRSGVHGRWLGAVSTEWGDENNWDDLLLPDSSTDVVIPPSAANWPVFKGDVTVGATCRSLVLLGPTSIMVINGNLILP